MHFFDLKCLKISLHLFSNDWSVTTFPTNFKRLIYGRSALNIADSFYSLAIILAVVDRYHIDVTDMSFFSLSMLIPTIFAFAYGRFIDQVTHKKSLLLGLQLLHILIVVAMIACLWFQGPLLVVYGLNMIFYVANSMLQSVTLGSVPQILHYQEDLIHRSVDIQYFAGNTLDILSNFIVSLLLTVVSYYVILNLSLPFFLLGVYCFYTIQVTWAAVSEPAFETTDANETAVNAPATAQESQSTRQSYRQFFGYFFSERLASKIILIEAFLGGATDFMLKFTPLYFAIFHYDVKWIGMAYALQRGVDFLGAFLAPKIKIPEFLFFPLDYLISGTGLLLIFCVDNLGVKSVAYFISFLVIGISGNVFEKMIYDHYRYDRLMGIHTIVTTLYSLFGVLFLVIPIYFNQIVLLAILFNLMTILFGVVLLVHYHFSTSESLTN